jgi:phospho-N-acetylmuramoyl-pentapeptide-transferase
MLGIVLGGAVAILVSLLGTPLLMRFLRSRGIRQPIHDAVTQHAAKAGTPTMGGAIITIAALAGYATARVVLGSAPSSDGVRVVLATAAAAVVGGIDDWLKVKSRRNVGGLSRRAKSALQIPVIVAFCAAYLASGSCRALSVTRCATGLDLGSIAWMVFAVGFFWATTNAVNFADGLEGLLAGTGAGTFVALLIVAFWQFRHPATYGVTNALDFAVIAACFGAACVGFLWWNGNPMSIFMGDVGSLAIGAAIAGLALSMNISLLMFVLGAVYVMEGVSVGLQIYSWKWYFKPRGAPRRLFRMAPIHHHFEVAGWPEGTVLVRFWILNAIAAALALAIFYLDALGASGLR